MHYFLKHLVTGVEIPLSEVKDYTVGRKDADITISDDKSISRKHAILKVTEERVAVIDCAAKYNTFINEKKINPNMPVRLDLNDIVKFGICGSDYTLKQDFSKFKFVTTTTGIGASKKEALSKVVKECGGVLIDSWSRHCTHLTIEKIILSEKLLEALINGKPFVVPEYWTALEKSVKNKKLKEPDLNKYNRPPIGENVNVADIEKNVFTYKEDRRTLFRDTVFVFFSMRMMDTLRRVIAQCGGECLAWQQNPPTLSELQRSPKKHILVPSSDNAHVEGCNEFISEYEKLGKRTIPLNEIAMAIVTCSTEQACNPDFDKAQHVLGHRTQKEANTEPLKFVPETEDTDSQDARSNVNKDEDMPLTIPPTLPTEMGDSEDVNLPSTSKVKKKNDVILIDDDSDDDMPPAKRSNKNDRTEKAKRIKLEETDTNTKSDTKAMKTKSIEAYFIKEKKPKNEVVDLDENDGPTIPAKRPNEEDIHRGAKKIKLEKENLEITLKESPESQCPREKLLEKSICRTQDFIKISSKKRKAMELAADPENQPVDPPRSTKKKAESDIQANPFAMIMSCSSKTKSTSTKPNPFEMAKKATQNEKSKAKEDIRENPFKRLNSSKSMFGDTKEKEQEHNNTRSGFAIFKDKSAEKHTSFGPDTTKRSSIGLSWMSKSSVNIKPEKEKVKHEDSELSKIIEIFRDCVKVQTLTLEKYKRHDTTVNNTTTTHDVTDGSKKANFKRFKKINPINPQINIITKNQLIKVGPGKTNAIDIARRNAAESDDEDLSQKKVRSKKIYF